MVPVDLDDRGHLFITAVDDQWQIEQLFPMLGPIFGPRALGPMAQVYVDVAEVAQERHENLPMGVNLYLQRDDSAHNNP